ncbi:hypothetical protein [Chitinivibrio alkaliphilus]|uniref:Outer membrane protein beta-barrel domain-containing protein n=1 Tax=Chitinivibrio alkaliphilus ACht1 TaxID=1313304 RepID=U7D9H1_9BACT|nr:hypothetical protein [Chitinivibrio alkaliphilus]ERP39039.1 hypothetical protein CALK_0533 [Chitinivibrio alkaliphilus ACht1]
MKKSMFCIFCIWVSLWGTPRTWGGRAGGGVRYDDMRMCVATDSGVAGGPMADIAVTAGYEISGDKLLRLSVPLMRPLLFGLRFDMVQFEPDITLEYYRNVDESLKRYFGPGAGVSLHYGPDYSSGTGDDRGDDFWAVGPYFSFVKGVKFIDSNSSLGLRGAYTPLVPLDSDRSVGTVLSIAIEYGRTF